MGSPLYEKNKEIIDIIEKLMREREDLFGEMSKFIFPEMFVAGLRYDKSAPPKQRSVLKIEGIKGQKVLLTDKKYLIHGFKDKWDALVPEKKVAVVANMLKRVDYPTQEEIDKLSEKGQDYQYGKLKKPDVEDFSTFLKSFGIGWAEEGSNIPNIIEDKSIDV